MFKKVILFSMFVMFCSPAIAEDVVTYSGSTYLDCRSIGDSSIWLNDTSDYSSVKTGFLYQPNGCGVLPSIPKYRKIIGGVVVEMSQAEKDEVDSAEASAQDASLRSGANSGFDGQSVTGLQYRALVKVILDEINNLRGKIRQYTVETEITYPDRTLSQAKTAIQNKITSGDVDE